MNFGVLFSSFLQASATVKIFIITGKDPLSYLLAAGESWFLSPSAVKHLGAEMGNIPRPAGLFLADLRSGMSSEQGSVGPA